MAPTEPTPFAGAASAPTRDPDAGAARPRAPGAPAHAVHRGNRVAVASVLAIAVLAVGSALAWLAVRAAADEAERRAHERLRTELGFRTDRVVGYLENVGRSLESIASARISRTIVGELTDALAADGASAYENIRRAYVFDNPNPPQRRQALLSARDGSLYSDVHARYHDWLLKFAIAHDYYDLFLADADGNIVYSVFKEDDFGTNLVDGDYSETALARTFSRARTSWSPNRALFSDFVEYPPSGHRPAAFVGSPILDEGRFAGALLVQLKQSRLDELLGGERVGDTGTRAYITGSDSLLRAGSGVPAAEVLRTPFESPAVAAAIANRSGVVDATGFHGDEVVAAYGPLRWSGVTWGLVVELDRATVERPVEELLRRLALAVVLCTVLAFVTGWLLADRPAPAPDPRPRDAP